jgi:hypothetical protein
MKKNVGFFTGFLLFVGLWAYGNESSSPSESIDAKYPHHFYLGPETFLFDVNTHVKNIKVEGSKFFGGLRLRYEYLTPSSFYAGVDLFSAVTNKSFHAKYKKYHFHVNNGITGFGNFEFRLGYTFSIRHGMLTPFLGMGAYSFGNNGRYFHFRESMVYYAGGLRSLFQLNSLFSIGWNLKVFRTDDTVQKFKYIFAGRRIKRTEHDNMWGGEVGMPLVWHVGSSKRWDIQLEPYFLKLSFSEVQNIYGARLLAGYRF